MNEQPPNSIPPPEPDLSVRIGGVVLRNPVLTASGTCGYALEYASFADLDQLGGFTTKSVTVRPRMGNPPQRVVETPGGMLNAIGLANVGLERFVETKLPDIRKMKTAVFVNVAGHSIGDYVAVCRTLDPYPELAGFELNVSCPNTADGLTFGTDPGLLRELMAAVRPVVRRGALIVKLSPNVTDVAVTARAAIEGGADALSMVNTFLGMAIDVRTWRPVLANNSGGLSGPAIRPMAIHLVHRVWREAARAAGVPIIGMGGIQTWEDAVEFMLAGATAVAVGTALFVDPGTPLRIIAGLRDYLSARGLRSVGELVGRVELNRPAAVEASAPGAG